MDTSTHHSTPRRRFAWSVALVLALSLFVGAGSSVAYAQSTSTSVFGFAPAGQTITVHSTSGTRRLTKANAKGRYAIRSLPAGVYDISLEKDGQAVDTRRNIQLIVGRGAQVNFACENDECAASPKK